jgi:hypothetical protein
LSWYSSGHPGGCLNRSRPLPSTSFPIPYSLIVLPFHATQSS